MKNPQPRLFAFLALGFVLATIVGTVSHELGHISVAKFLGYKTKLHFAAMESDVYERLDMLETYYNANKEKITAETPSQEKAYFRKAYKKLGSDNQLILWGGPVQTMLTGTIGLILLLYRRKRIREAGMKVFDWIAVFLAFFWSRELFNLLGIAVYHIIPATHSIKGGDETRISRYLGYPIFSLNIIFGAVAALILTYVVFKIIPKQHRLTFIAAGIAGSALGFILWMQILGPVLLP